MGNIREITLQYLQARNTGDTKYMDDVISNDVTWHIMGHSSSIAQSYVGKEKTYSVVFKIFQENFVQGSLKIDIIDIYTDERRNTTIALYRERATSINGNTLDIDSVLITKYKDGKMHEVWEIFDLLSLTEAIGNDFSKYLSVFLPRTLKTNDNKN